jgi:hypothetical protein
MRYFNFRSWKKFIFDGRYMYLYRNRRAVGSIPTRGSCAAFFAAFPGQVLKCIYIYILTWITNPKNSIQNINTTKWSARNQIIEVHMYFYSFNTLRPSLYFLSPQTIPEFTVISIGKRLIVVTTSQSYFLLFPFISYFSFLSFFIS